MQSSVKNAPLYFKNLDGLRFIAAFFVIFGHCQSIIAEKFKTTPYSPFADKLASFGVDFFFVLSGFLISFLLFEELALTGTIQIRKFYMRRILRLWPLYFIFSFTAIFTASYFIQTLGLFDRPQSWTEMRTNLLYLSSFSVNYQILIGINAPSSYTVSHFWSLSVEEQFYLIWAPIVWVFRKNILLLLILTTSIGVLMTVWEPDIYQKWFGNNAHAAPYYTTYSRFIFFGLGALLAYCVQKKFLMNFYTHIPIWVFKYGQKVLSVLVITLSSYYLFNSIYYSETNERFINAAISVSLVAAVIMEHTVVNLEFGFLKYLGKISFGIYVFHLVSIRLVWFFLERYPLSKTLFYVLLPLLATLLAIFLAVISYEFIEKWFLKQKNKFNFG